VPIQVQPATADRWNDVVAVFGRRGDDASWDWCQLFLQSDAASAANDEPRDNRGALHQQITHSLVPPGLIAYVEARPVGWTRVGPRSSFPGVRGNRALAKLLSDEDAGAWWVTCFAVDARHRRSGVGAALLAGAVAFARDHEARTVEGHPVDVARLRASRVSGSAIYTGTLAMFVAAGFQEVGRTYPTRPLMRLAL
jgi:GNAT superfamily N-acetyltransferase